MFSTHLIRKLEKLDANTKEVMLAVMEEIEQHREAQVTKTEFNELKEIVKALGQTTDRLVQAQERTEVAIESLAKAQERNETDINELKNVVNNLAKAQERTEKAQERTEAAIESLAKAQERTEKAQERTEKALESLAKAQERNETDINQLKNVVNNLTKAQERTEAAIESLGKAQERTEKAQERTEAAIESLGKAQERTEKAQERTEAAIESLAKAQERTENSVRNTRHQLGGVSRSMAYALENEAFRKLPAYLKSHHQLDISKHFVRTYVGDEEINIFAKANRENGDEVLVVGETVVKLDDYSKMGQLDKNVKVVKSQFNLPVVPLLITHIANPIMLKKARERGVMVVQSFEWEQ